MEDRGLLLLTGYYYSLRCETQLNQLCLGANHSWKQKEKGRGILTPTLVHTLILEVFLKFFLAKERASREAATMSCEEERRERKNLWFLPWPRISLFMQMAAVNRIKVLITKVTKYSNLANMWAGVDPGKLILYQQSIPTRVVRAIRCHLILLIALIGVKHGICRVICSSVS